jgi:hypothetical protein
MAIGAAVAKDRDAAATKGMSAGGMSAVGILAAGTFAAGTLASDVSAADGAAEISAAGIGAAGIGAADVGAADGAVVDTGDFAAVAGVFGASDCVACEGRSAAPLATASSFVTVARAIAA